MAFQPWMIPLATSAASAVYRSLNPERAMQIRENVLNSQMELRNTIARRAFGVLTPADADTIKRQAEPQVNAVQANVASRGLGSSGAGAQVIAEAQQGAFTQAREQAQQMLPVYDQAILGSANALLMNDGSFFDDLNAIASLIAEEVELDPDGAENDTELKEVIRQIWTIAGQPTPTSTRGTSPGMPPVSNSAAYVRQRGGWL